MFGLVYALRHQIFETLRNLQHVNYWFLLLVIPLQLLSYDVLARMYRDLLQHLGQPVGYRSMYRVALELNFVNHAFPSGGISGISYFGVRLRSYGVKGSTATLLQFVKFFLIFISFQILLGIGLLALAIGDKANDIMLLVAGVLATGTLAATLIAAYIIGSKERIADFFASLTRGLNWLISWVRPKHPETISIDKVRASMYEMHDNYEAMKGASGLLRKCLLYALVGNMCEVLTVYVFYLAFGEAVNVGAVIIAYAIANFAGLVSVLPGGVGVYEALMTGVLVAGGVPAALSIPVTIMYRVLNMMVQLIPGWALYHMWVREGRVK